MKKTFGPVRSEEREKLKKVGPVAAAEDSEAREVGAVRRGKDPARLSLDPTLSGGQVFLSLVRWLVPEERHQLACLGEGSQPRGERPANPEETDDGVRGEE